MKSNAMKKATFEFLVKTPRDQVTRKTASQAS